VQNARWRGGCGLLAQALAGGVAPRSAKNLQVQAEGRCGLRVVRPCRCEQRDGPLHLLQTLIGHGYSDQDFSTLLLLQATASGIELKSENVDISDGLS